MEACRLDLMLAKEYEEHQSLIDKCCSRVTAFQRHFNGISTSF